MSCVLFIFKTACSCPSRLKFATIEDAQAAFAPFFNPLVRGSKNKCRMVAPQVSRTNTKRQKIKRKKRKGLFRSDFAVSQNRADCYPIATRWTERRNTRAFGAANEGKSPRVPSKKGTPTGCTKKLAYFQEYLYKNFKKTVKKGGEALSELNRHIRQLQTAAKKIEKTASIVDDLRDYAKTDGGRLTSFGKGLVGLCLEAGMPQSEIARILDISNSAVSQNAARLKNTEG